MYAVPRTIVHARPLVFSDCSAAYLARPKLIGWLGEDFMTETSTKWSTPDVLAALIRFRLPSRSVASGVEPGSSRPWMHEITAVTPEKADSRLAGLRTSPSTTSISSEVRWA